MRSVVDQGRRIERGRLAYYYSEATSAYWDGLWNRRINSKYFDEYREGSLGLLERSLMRHLPTQGRILEAGCGIGQYVVALRARRYDCVGVDFAATSLRRVKAILPELPVVAGDILSMSFGAATFSAVISLGVVEHRRDGPEPFLREMRRVLRNDGRLLISVPHFNALRRSRARCGAYQAECAGVPFYQWAFTPDEFRRILGAEGFTVIEEVDYDYFKCLADELTWIDRLPSVLRKALIRSLGLIPAVRSGCGHMRLYIAGRSSAERAGRL